MGRWMEVLSRRPEAGAASSISDYKEAIVGEIAPNPLMNAYGILPKEIRHRFPMLERINRNSKEYNNDTQQILLDFNDISELDKELYYLRRLCRCEETLYLSGRQFDGEYFMTRWRAMTSPEEFEDWLSGIERLIQSAISDKAWIMFSV